MMDRKSPPRQKLATMVAVCAILTMDHAELAAADDKPHVPAPNDVVMRTLQFRKVNPGSEMDVFQAIRDFHVTRLEWTYIDFNERDRENVAKVKAMGVLFGGAGSASLHEGISEFPSQPQSVHMLDLNGTPVVQPHMRGWDHFRGIGDPTNPEYYDHHLAYYKKVVDWGAKVLHRDEPESPVFAAQRYGGGFSPTGLAGFREWLKGNLTAEEIMNLGISDIESFDYAEWLRERGAPTGDAFASFDDALKPYWIRFWGDATTKFWHRMISEIKKYANDPAIAFSTNNSSLQMWEPYHCEFDYANSELMLETAHPQHIWERSQEARQRGKVQIFGAPKTRSQAVSEAEKTALLRKVFATAYACGMLAKVPWDVYDQSPDGKARYFASPADLADLCAFVRAFDWSGYEEAGAVGPGLPEIEGQTPRIEGGGGGVYAFLRRSERPDAPTLVHLIDWGVPVSDPEQPGEFISPTGKRFPLRSTAETMIRTAPEAFELVLPRDAVTGEQEAEFHLVVPAPYDIAAHTQASETGDYSKVFERVSIVPKIIGSEVRLAIPPLAPWGVVEIVNR